MRKLKRMNEDYSYKSSKGKVAAAYRDLTQEVMKLEKQREKHKADACR